MIDKDYKFLVGKYKGSSIYDVAEIDWSYLRWVVENVDGLSEEIKSKLEDLILDAFCNIEVFRDDFWYD